MTFKLVLSAIVILCLLCSNCKKPDNSVSKFTADELSKTDWQTIENKVRGTKVAFAMWAGDEARNLFFRKVATAKIKEKFDIDLQIIPLGDTAEIIAKLLNEKSSGKTSAGSVDVIWINGENFRTAKQGNLLFGEFAKHLPNLRYYDSEAGRRDFGTPIDNLEAPWQRAQFVLAFDTARFVEPPRDFDAMGIWIKNHPGRFAYIAPPDFTGSAFLRHILFHFGGGAANFQTFDEEIYRNASDKTFNFLNEIKPYLWRKGETYPNSTKELDKLFANSEIDFSFGYGANFASERIKRGEFPPSVRTFVFDSGTISNYNFLTIPFNAENPVGASVVINYFMSHEFQVEQSQQLGSIYPHKLSALSEAELKSLTILTLNAATLSDEELASHSIPEADSEYLSRLEKDWREKVLLK
ncbi:MAG: ABC transporter substrate-binding protein [Pyrinomonadaceae bacterium]|nr:ABC transporter substrate-binding protein [Pyrinomonadaceae bacterium]